MPVFDSMTLSRRMALTYALVLALTLAVLYSGYSALNAVVAQAPQFKTLAGDAQSSKTISIFQRPVLVRSAMAALLVAESLCGMLCTVISSGCGDGLLSLFILVIATFIL